MNEKLKQTIEQFLAECRISDGGYAPVEPGDIEQLHGIIGFLINEKWGADPDGDRPIGWRLINRKEFEPLYYNLVPYLYPAFELAGNDNETSDKVIEAHADAVYANLDRAINGVQMYRRQEEDIKRAQKEINERTCS